MTDTRQVSWLLIYEVKWSEVAQSCPTLCNPMDSSLPGSSVHGIFQARILEWAAISFSRGSSQPRDWTGVSCTADRSFIIWATRGQINSVQNSPVTLSQGRLERSLQAEVLQMHRGLSPISKREKKCGARMGSYWRFMTQKAFWHWFLVNVISRN